MHKGKKARLEAKGWRLGSAQEFLGVSDQESAYVELRLRLAESLRVRRQKRKLSQTDPRALPCRCRADDQLDVSRAAFCFALVA
jgi:hypothetical protein